MIDKYFITGVLLFTLIYFGMHVIMGVLEVML
jgi:hypothetical protein